MGAYSPRTFLDYYPQELFLIFLVNMQYYFSSVLILFYLPTYYNISVDKYINIYSYEFQVPSFGT